MIDRVLAAGALALSVGFLQPAHASSHCSDVLLTVEQLFMEVSSESTSCEAELDTARHLMEQGREQALACGCEAAAENFSFKIDISNSSDYSCGNKRQGLGTLQSSIPDTIACCYGC